MKKQKIIIAGGTGFLGKLLIDHFKNSRLEMVVLTRSSHMNQHGVRYIKWDGATLENWKQELEGSWALINLAGKSVDCRYNKRNKERIYVSRLHSTKVLGEAIISCKCPPEVWINASSATIYRHAEDRIMDEDQGELGEGFSVDVCQRWEETFENFACPHTRKIALRMAIVLDPQGGALKALVNMVKCGMGGPQGNGKQYFSWLHRQDFVEIIDFILRCPEVQGTYNASAPYPEQNDKLMGYLRTICKVTWGMPLPKWLLEIGAWIIGTETELILKSRRVVPKKLLASGYLFKYPRLNEAIENLLLGR